METETSSLSMESSRISRRSGEFCDRDMNRNINRRKFLALAGAFGLCSARLLATGHAQLLLPERSLLTAPLELAGAWPEAPADAVMRVLLRVRAVCLSGINLLSDRQPVALRIDNR